MYTLLKKISYVTTAAVLLVALNGVPVYEHFCKTHCHHDVAVFVDKGHDNHCCSGHQLQEHHHPLTCNNDPGQNRCCQTTFHYKQLDAKFFPASVQFEFDTTESEEVNYRFAENIHHAIEVSDYSITRGKPPSGVGKSLIIFLGQQKTSPEPFFFFF